MKKNKLKLSNKASFILVLVMIALISFFISTSLKSNETPGYKTVRAVITVKNNTEHTIPLMHYSSNVDDSFAQIENLKQGEEITSELKVPFKVEGSLVLTFIDENNVEHKASIIGYLMPLGHKANVIINNANSNGFDVTVDTIE